MIVIPQFGDQLGNGAMVEQRGFGISMKLNEITVDRFSTNLKQVLTDK